jgi:hypothetical protein
MEKEKNNYLRNGIMIGVGVTALAAAIAGTYFMYGSKNAAKNRRQVKSWMLKAKGEVMEKIENLSDLSEEMYQKIVQEEANKYGALKNIEKNEVSEFVEELKSHWKDIAHELSTHKEVLKK